MIVVVGEALVDLVVSADGSVTSVLGGAPFNTARACARLGADVVFVGAVSDDRFGRLLVDRLAADGVDVEHVRRVDVPTSLALAELDEGGAASYRFYLQGTSLRELHEVPDLAADVVFTGGLALALDPLASAVERHVASTAGGPLVMIDVNARPLAIDDPAGYASRVHRVLAGADVVKVSDEDLAHLMPGVETVEAARRLLGSGPRLVLMTAGGGAVRVFTASAEASVDVPAVTVVDTIGAGDSFDAGFLAWWTAHGLGRSDTASLDAVVPAVRAASAVAAVVCSRRGADPPWRDELGGPWTEG